MKFTSHAVGMLGNEMDLLSRETTNIKKETKKVIFTNNITVDIKNFSYGDNDKFMIKDINLTINKGDKIGIIGASGSGKSTIIEILLGILKPQKGDVKIDGNIILSDKETLPNTASTVTTASRSIYRSSSKLDAQHTTI